MKPVYGGFNTVSIDCINNSCNNGTYWSDKVCEICRKIIPKHIQEEQFHNFYKGKNEDRINKK